MSIDLLHDKIRKLRMPVIIDLAVKEELLPPHLLEEGGFAPAYFRFCREILEGMGESVPGVRFSFDFFALLGKDGLEMLSQLMKKAGELGYYVLLDGPQTLTPWSAELAANTIFGGEEYPCDGLLICPYIGSDSVKPFVPACTKGDRDLFVTVRTPNKSASELQDLLTGNRLVHGVAAEMVNRLGDPIFTKCGFSRICAAVSATSADSLRNLRAQYKRMFLLVDGLDYPSGNGKNCSYAFDRFGYGAALSVGPSVTAVWKETEGSDGKDYIALAIQAADRIKKNLQRYFTIF